MTKAKDFGYLGNDFQEKLIAQIINDSRFGQNIIELIIPQYFDNISYKSLIAYIKNFYKTFHNTIPTFPALTETVLAEEKDEITRIHLKSLIAKIKERTGEDVEHTQKRALNFCKQQNLKKAINEAMKIMENGDFEAYDQLEPLMKKVVEVGDKGSEPIEVLDNIASVLSDDFRHPIPTGITGIDELIGGGLGRGELALFLGAMGVGKTTFLTKVANTASNKGYNVVQIVFEDSEKIIQRKHLACWSKINLYELNDRKDEALAKISELPENRGRLVIKRFSSDRTTVTDVKNFLRKLTGDGIKPDIVILDYIDCLTPAAATGDGQTANEGSVVRQLEAMAVDFDIALWSALQGNRSSINAEITEMDNMGGSIKRGQVAHLVISASKSLEQREAGLANLAILKSRFGKDGVTFKNSIFNNGTLEISTEASTLLTAMGLEQEKKNSAQDRINEVMRKIKQ